MPNLTKADYNLVRCFFAVVLGIALMYVKLFGMIGILGSSVLHVFAHGDRQKRGLSRLLVCLHVPLALHSAYRAITLFRNDFLGWGLLLLAVVCWVSLVFNGYVFYRATDWNPQKTNA